MPRTVDAVAHEMKRDEFLDAAERLLRTKGFERASVQDVLNATGASKGAFYHYFDSKQDLLGALAERMADTIAGDLRRADDASESSALERLNRMFAALGGTKIRHRETIVGMLRVWFSDANAAARLRLRAGISARIAPLLRDVLDQGVRDGTLTAEPGVERVLALMIQDHNDEIGQRFLESAAEGGAIDELMADAGATIAAYTGAIERILGAAPGSVELVDMDTLRAWLQPDDANDANDAEGVD